MPFRVRRRHEREANDVRSRDPQFIEQRPQRRGELHNATAVAKRATVPAARQVRQDYVKRPSSERTCKASQLRSIEPVYEKQWTPAPAFQVVQRSISVLNIATELSQFFLEVFSSTSTISAAMG